MNRHDKPDSNHPRDVLPYLCRRFYYQGWMSGTGGALSMKHGDEIYITPSGVQKEMVEPEDLFVVSCEGDRISAPDPERKLKQSTCTPLIMTALRVRGANVVYHLHNASSVMVSILNAGTEFRITHQKLIQGIQKGNSEQHFDFNETLVVPIVENKSTEDEIQESFERAIKDYPETSGLLIRRHGMYVWGPTWQKTKAMAECYDYLFDIAIRMNFHGHDPAKPAIPPEGAYQ